MKINLLAVAALSALFGVAQVRAADGAAAFSPEERAILRSLCAEFSATIRTSGLSTNLPVAVLPVVGDKDEWLHSQLKNALTGAGLVCVEGREDPMWTAIVSEIRWDELKDDWLDPDTLVKFGSLKGARMLLYGRLSLDREGDGTVVPELTLHVSDVETKEHRFGETFPRYAEDGTFLPWWRKDVPVPEPYVYAQEPVESLVSVRVEASAADEESEPLVSRLAETVQDALADAGFSVVYDGNADVSAVLRASMRLSDREEDHYAYRGTVSGSIVLPGTKRVVARETFREYGKLTLWKDAAVAALADVFAPGIRDWALANTTPAKCGLRVQTCTVSFVAFDGPEASARISQFVDAAKSLDGVVSCTLAQRLPTGNEASFRVVSRAGSFPEGFVHVLAQAHPELKIWPTLVPVAPQQ